MAEDIKFLPDFPNMETGFACSFIRGDFGTALTSKVLEWKILEGRVGYWRNDATNRKTGIIGIGIDFDKIPCEIEYCWKDLLKTSLSIWLGYDTQYKELDLGAIATLVKISF